MNYEDIIKFWKNKKINTYDKLSNILESYSVNFAYNSGKIENQEITYHDTREIFDKNKVTSYTGSLKTLFEIQNSKDAYKEILNAYKNKQIINEEFIKRIHKILTKGTYDETSYNSGERPGEYKIHDYVTGIKEVGASSEDTKDEMNELMEEIQNINDNDILIAAAYFHAKFENIHPFADGNGRTVRILMNYLLINHNHPPIIIFDEDKIEYYKVLEEFDENINLKPLINFLKKELIKTWENQIQNKTVNSSLKNYID